MDFRQLRYFVAVAEEANIGRAALRLHISQPPLTRQIQQIEEEMGVRLFNRTPRGVGLTDAGALLLGEARNLLALFEQATERVKRAGQGQLGRIDIAIFGSAILDFIPKLMLTFRQLHPDVRVLLHNMTKTEQIEALRQRRITVGFNRILEEAPDIKAELVMTEPLFVAVNRHHSLSREREIPLRALAEMPLVLFPTGPRPSFIDRVFEMCREEGFEPWVVQEVGDAVTGVALVGGGLGMCIVPESATNLRLPGVMFRPLIKSPPAVVDLTCIYRANDDSPILGAFLEVLRSYKSLHTLREKSPRTAAR